jgi:hypothetical protein
MYFLNTANKLDFINIRIDIEIANFIDVIYTSSVLVKKVAFIHGNKVVSLDDFEFSRSEMENISYRTYSFSAKTYPELLRVTDESFRLIWLNIVGLNESNFQDNWNFVQEGFDEEIKEEFYKVSDNKEEKEDASLIEEKLKRTAVLKNAASKFSVLNKPPEDIKK